VPGDHWFRTDASGLELLRWPASAMDYYSRSDVLARERPCRPGGAGFSDGQRRCALSQRCTRVRTSHQFRSVRGRTLRCLRPRACLPTTGLPRPFLCPARARRPCASHCISPNRRVCCGRCRLPRGLLSIQRPRPRCGWRWGIRSPRRIRRPPIAHLCGGGRPRAGLTLHMRGGRDIFDAATLTERPVPDPLLITVGYGTNDWNGGANVGRRGVSPAAARPLSRHTRRSAAADMARAGRLTVRSRRRIQPARRWRVPGGSW